MPWRIPAAHGTWGGWGVGGGQVGHGEEPADSLVAFTEANDKATGSCFNRELFLKTSVSKVNGSGFSCRFLFLGGFHGRTCR